MRFNSSSDCQVLIVGAGPAGLVLATELLTQGISPRIIEQRDGPVMESRALAIHPRSLELFDARGIEDRLLERGQPNRRMRLYIDGKNLVTLEMRHNGSRFPYSLDIPQRETEFVLRDRIGELGGVVEPRVELIDFEQNETGVVAQVRDASGALQSINAEYMVGCDGAHSRVRRGLGLRFEGHPYPQKWLLADVRLDWNSRHDEAHAFFRSDGGSLVVIPLPGGRWRVVVPFVRGRAPEQPTLEEIQTLVDQRAPRKLVLSDPVWLSNFRCHLRSTDTYRVGRVFLAGDAAHIHTPAGGQGMNIGMQDAFNLGWKLALVISGSSPDWLLDTYGEERRPVARGVLQLTDGIVTMAQITNPFKRHLRDMVVPLASRLPTIQKRATRRTGQLHVAYPSSRLTMTDSHGKRMLPGERMPDAEVIGEHGRMRLYEALRCGKHVLVAPATSTVNAEIEPYRSLLEVVRWTAGGARRVLVRPDGYIAARGTNVAAYLRELFALWAPANADAVKEVA